MCVTALLKRRRRRRQRVSTLADSAGPQRGTQSSSGSASVGRHQVEVSALSPHRPPPLEDLDTPTPPGPPPPPQPPPPWHKPPNISARTRI